MKKIIRSIALVVALGLHFSLMPGGVNAQNSSADHIDQGARQMLASKDTAFVLEAAQGGLAEVQLGKLAAEKGSDPDVKAFGQQMVDDHTKANDQLQAIAHDRKMTLPETLSSKDQATSDRLRKLSGAAFDKAYIADMVKDHQMDVKAFGKEATSGENPAVTNFASLTLPVLQSHLDKAKAIHAKIGGSQK